MNSPHILTGLHPTRVQPLVAEFAREHLDKTNTRFKANSGIPNDAKGPNMGRGCALLGPLQVVEHEFRRQRRRILESLAAAQESRDLDRPALPKVPLLRASWPLLDSIWGISKGSWRVLGNLGSLVSCQVVSRCRWKAACLASCQGLL